jgi:hypothetical protein
VKPEQFRNYEVGAKWDVVRDLSVTTALYRLNRTNTRATDPNDPTRIVQTGSQRTNGYEVGANGRVAPLWSIAGGYTYQDGYVTSATTAAAAGAQVAQVPHHMLSLWNNYQLHPRVAAGLGILSRSECSRRSTTPCGCRLYARGCGRLRDAHAAAARSAERREPVQQGLLHQRRQQHQHLAGISASCQGSADRDLLSAISSTRLLVEAAVEALVDAGTPALVDGEPLAAGIAEDETRSLRDLERLLDRQSSRRSPAADARPRCRLPGR